MEHPEESGTGYPEEQPDEVAGDQPERRDRKKRDETSGDEDRGTATGNPKNAGADEAGS